MPYEIPADVESRILAQVENGLFASKDEVLREAIDSLERQQRGLTQLQKMVAVANEDIAAGRVGPFDAARSKAAVRIRLAEHGIVNE